MYTYKKYFKSKGYDYCSGQNTASSKYHYLWVNKGLEEFVIDIGKINIKTQEVTLDPKAEALPKKDIERLINSATK